MQRKIITHWLIYCLLRLLSFPFRYLPYSLLHSFGAILGTIAYHLLPTFRKITLSNLALAPTLELSPKERITTAKKAFQNLMITCLEYSKLEKESNLTKLAVCENPEVANSILRSGKGVIFFCGHQANWEVLFLDGTMRMRGTAIARTLSNPFLDRWICKVRKQFGGEIIAPRQAIREGMRALKTGSFLGIVGDQGMPNSGFSSLFLGRAAWTSPLPAILSYRTGCPILVATIVRKAGKYYIRYSDPLWPSLKSPFQHEVKRLMGSALSLLEESIQQTPGQWLWQHKRWKQQEGGRLKMRFRYLES